MKTTFLLLLAPLFLFSQIDTVSNITILEKKDSIGKTISFIISEKSEDSFNEEMQLDNLLFHYSRVFKKEEDFFKIIEKYRRKTTKL